MLSPCFNSYPRALSCLIHDLDTFAHLHCNAKYLGSKCAYTSSFDPAIKFTVEDNKEDDSIPFLDTIVKPEEDGSLYITVYKKPTHSDQYLQWDSHHNLSAKFSVINTLTIGPKLCAVILSCSNKKKNTPGKLSPNANIPSGLWTRWRKGSTGLPVRPLMGLTTRVPMVPLLPPEKLRVRAT